VAVPGAARAGRRAGGRLQGGGQRGAAGPDVVLGVPPGDARPHRRHRPGPFQGLDLGLFVRAGRHRAPGGARCKLAASRTLAAGWGPAGNLDPSVRCGAGQNLRPSTVAGSWLTLMPLAWRSQSASRRPGQCVTPGCPQRLRRRRHGRGQDPAACSASAVFGPPGRGASASPAIPRPAYWRRHLTTAGSVQPGRRRSAPRSARPRPAARPGPVPPPGLRPAGIGHRQNADVIGHVPWSRVSAET